MVDVGTIFVYYGNVRIMELNNFKEKTPLHYFYEFLKSVEEQHLDNHVVIKEEDWDNMCGISITSQLKNRQTDNICFNFYDDGQFRAIIHKDRQ